MHHPLYLQARGKTWFLVVFHATTMIVGVFILLGAIYTQMQPYKYTSSNLAFRHALKMNEASDIRQFAEIWEWLETIAQNIGGRTLGHVNSNCAYNDPNTQFITVDNKTYEIHNPATQYGVCQNDQFVDAANDPVFLTGDNELMLFGIFTKRSPDRYSRQKSVGNLNRHRIRHKLALPIDARIDPKVAEICQAPWNRSNVCVKEDGFSIPGYYDNSVGSALNWPGELRGGRSVFNATSAHGFLHRSAENFLELLPCYSYTEDKYVQWGDATFEEEDVDSFALTSCEFAWITSGFDTRKLCLDYLNDQPTPEQAYVAKRFQFESIIDMLDFFNGCTDILAATHDELEFMYTEALDVFRTHLTYDDSYGTFFNTSSQGAWVADHTKIQSSLVFHRVLDISTREVTLYLVTRNLGDEALFYTLLRVKYTHKTDGSIRVILKPTYIPIIQYYYGLDGYPFIPTGLFFFEIFVLAFFTFFFVREVWQLYRFGGTHLKDKRERNLKEQSERELEMTLKLNPQSIGVSHTSPIGDLEVNVMSTYQSSSVEYIGEIRENGCEDIDVEAGASSIEKMDTESINGCNRDQHHHQASDIVRSSKVMPISDRDAIGDAGATEENKLNNTSSIKIVRPISSISKKSELSKKVSIREMAESFITVIPDLIPWTNVLDWLCIGVILFGIIYRILYIKLCREFHNFVTQYETDFELHFDVIITKEIVIANHEYSLRLVCLCAVVLGLVQFFRYISFDKRMGLVSATLYSCLTELAPILFVFCVVFSAYAVLGSQMYGQQLEAFETFTDSLTTLLLMMLGEYGVFDAMRKINPLETKLFFWTFILLILFLLLNMVLAIVLTIHEKNYDMIKEWEISEIEKEKKAENKSKAA